MSQLFMFVAHRDVTVTSLKGYSFNFKKGIPQHVPKQCHAEVIERGILPVDQDGSLDPAKLDEIAQEGDPKARIVLAPETQAERDEKINEALKAIAKRNRSEDFTAGGVPSPAAVSSALGWKVDGREIRPLWNKLRQDAAQG